mmetsp:Transcript_6020/g.19305  ORF Transcript_6020/g.19305 Transcript_6020/m.19305 type:complete len:86 (-) Transcript_6020:1823-2080(-)
MLWDGVAVLADDAISEAPWPSGSLTAGTVTTAEADWPEEPAFTGVTPADVGWREEPALADAAPAEFARLPALQTPVLGSEGVHWL